MQSTLIDVSFDIQATTDTVVSIGTTTYGAATTPITLDQIPNNNIWLQENHDGLQRLCTSKPYGTILTATLIGTSGAYVVSSTPFETYYEAGVNIKSHPIHRPR